MQCVRLQRAVGLGLAAGIVCAACGCMARMVRADIQSPDAETRGRAIREAAQRRDERAIPLIVDRLEDEDQSVRLFAILALEEMTGQRMGYLYYKPTGTQADALRRWRDYVTRRGTEGWVPGGPPRAASPTGHPGPAGHTRTSDHAGAASRP